MLAITEELKSLKNKIIQEIDELNLIERVEEKLKTIGIYNGRNDADLSTVTQALVDNKIKILKEDVSAKIDYVQSTITVEVSTATTYVPGMCDEAATCESLREDAPTITDTLQTTTAILPATIEAINSVADLIFDSLRPQLFLKIDQAQAEITKKLQIDRKKSEKTNQNKVIIFFIFLSFSYESEHNIS